MGCEFNSFFSIAFSIIANCKEKVYSVCFLPLGGTHSLWVPSTVRGRKCIFSITKGLNLSFFFLLTIHNWHQKLWPVLVDLLNNLFLIFKQYYTFFHTFFHLYIFQKIINNIIQIPLPNGPYITKLFGRETTVMLRTQLIHVNLLLLVNY